MMQKLASWLSEQGFWTAEDRRRSRRYARRRVVVGCTPRLATTADEVLVADLLADGTCGSAFRCSRSG